MHAKYLNFVNILLKLVFKIIIYYFYMILFLSIIIYIFIIVL